MNPEFAVKRIKDNTIVVDTDKATYQGRPFKSLGGFGRRKFENLLVMHSHQKIGGVPKIRYE